MQEQQELQARVFFGRDRSNVGLVVAVDIDMLVVAMAVVLATAVKGEFFLIVVFFYFLHPT